MKHLLYICAFLIFLFSCNPKQDEASANMWYEHTKTEILRQSDTRADSVIIAYYKEDSLHKEINSFKNGNVYFSEHFYKGIKRGETYFSLNHLFELRREICENGLISFEGIFAQGGFYGLSTWKYCNGNMKKQGIRFKNKEIGVWKEFDETGKLIKETNNGEKELLNSLPSI